MNNIQEAFLAALLDHDRLGIGREEGGYNLSAITCYQQICRLASDSRYGGR